MNIAQCAGLALALVAASGTAQAQSQTIEMRRSPSGYFVAPVFIGEDGPYAFAPDTGASHTAIAQPLAELHGFVSNLQGAIAVQTLTEEIEAERHVLVNLSLGQRLAPDLDVVVTPIAPDVELELYGLLGSDFFAGHVVRLDYPRATLTVDAPPPHHADAQMHPSRQVLVGAAEAEHIPGDIQVLIDTGSPVTLVNSTLAQTLRSRTPLRLVTLGSISRIADSVESHDLAILDRFRLGGICARRIGVHVADLDVFRALGWEDTPAMIVGLDMLQNAVLTIDYATGEAQLDADRQAWSCTSSRRSQLSH